MDTKDQHSPAASLLSDPDARAIVRLLGEIAGLTDPLPERKRRLLAGVARIVAADMSLWTHANNLDHPRPVPFAFVHDGWTDERQKVLFIQGSQHPSCSDVFDVPVIRAAQPHATRTRTQIVPDDRAWRDSPLYRDFWAPAGIEHYLASVVRTAPDVCSAMFFLRRAGRPDFGPRERGIVHLIASEIDWLHRAGTDVPAADRVTALSPRLREVLLLTLTGDGRKQVAAKLALSEHTVAGYMKQLHQHFSVTSRGELMALFLSGGHTPAAHPPHPQ